MISSHDFLLPSLGESPQTEKCLEQIVADDNILDVKWLSALHEPVA